MGADIPSKDWVYIGGFLVVPFLAAVLPFILGWRAAGKTSENKDPVERLREDFVRAHAQHDAKLDSIHIIVSTMALGLGSSRQDREEQKDA